MFRPLGSQVESREARRASVAPHVVFALLAGFTPAARAQSQGSFGIGVGTVRYAGGTKVSTASFSPAYTLDASHASLSLAGTFASLPLGVWSSQGRGDVWVVTPPAFGGVRLGLQGSALGTARTDGGWTAATHGVAELLWWGQSWGVGLGAGPSAGWIAGAPSVTALHVRARTWWRAGALDYSVNVEPTRFLGAWFTDATASVTANRRPVATSLWATARLSSAYGSKAAGGVQVRIFPTPRVALELGGGSYLADPYQGLPRGGYVTAGLRLFTARRAAPEAAPQPTWPPLEPERRGDSTVVRFRMEGASSVAIAGNWDGWQTHALSAIGSDIWTGALALRPGTYRFNLLVDGKEWVVPNGVEIVTEDGGGLVALLLVP